MAVMADLKPRSRVVTDGIERAAARGMLRAVGMGDDDWEKPQIGIASSWNEITPCNLSLDRLALAAKEGVRDNPGRLLIAQRLMLEAQGVGEQSRQLLDVLLEAVQEEANYIGDD